MNTQQLEENLLNQFQDLPKRNMKKTSDVLNSSLEVLHIRIPALRKVRVLDFDTLSQKEKLLTVSHVFQETFYSEIATWSLIQLESIDSDILIEHKKTLLDLSLSVENWWHADLLSSIYARVLDYHKLLLEDFHQWAKSDFMWQRRLSLTSLLYYSSMRKRPLEVDTILKQIDMLFKDDEYYVQKGVGWTLRECYNLYPRETFEYLKKHAKMISPHAWQASTEKISFEGKEYLRNIRKDLV